MFFRVSDRVSTGSYYTQGKDTQCFFLLRDQNRLYAEYHNEPRCEKTGLWGFRPCLTQTRLYSHTRWLDASNFVFRKKRDCNIYVVKTKALISFAVTAKLISLAVTAKLICVFVFAHAKSRFSHDTAQL